MVDNFPAKPAENFASACGVLGCFLRTHLPNMRMIIREKWLGWRLILRIAFFDLALKGQVKIITHKTSIKDGPYTGLSNKSDQEPVIFYLLS